MAQYLQQRLSGHQPFPLLQPVQHPSPSCKLSIGAIFLKKLYIYVYTYVYIYVYIYVYMCIYIYLLLDAILPEKKQCLTLSPHVAPCSQQLTDYRGTKHGFCPFPFLPPSLHHEFLQRALPYIRIPVLQFKVFFWRNLK